MFGVHPVRTHVERDTKDFRIRVCTPSNAVGCFNADNRETCRFEGASSRDSRSSGTNDNDVKVMRVLSEELCLSGVGVLRSFCP